MRRAFSTSTSTSGAGAGAAGVAWSLPMWVPARSSPRLSVDAAPADEVEVEVVEVVEARRRMRASRAREAANRIKCASNLRVIGQGIMIYANENRGAFPRTSYDKEAADPVPTEYTGSSHNSPR